MRRFSEVNCFAPETLRFVKQAFAKLTGVFN